MFWRGREESSNVETRSGFGRTGIALGGAGGLVVVVLSLLFGVDLTSIVGPSAQVPEADPRSSRQAEQRLTPQQKELTSFTKVVLKDTEVVWGEQFQKIGRSYRLPSMVLFTGQVQSACGSANAAVGPFYCPGDE